MKVDFFVTIGYNRDTGGRGGGGGGDNNTASQTYITNNDENDKLNSIFMSKSVVLIPRVVLVCCSRAIVVSFGFAKLNDYPIWKNIISKNRAMWRGDTIQMGRAIVFQSKI